MKIVKIIIALAVLAGVGVFIRFLLQPDPKAVVKRAKQLLVDAGTLHYETAMSATGSLSTAKVVPSGKDGSGMFQGEIKTDADLNAPAGGASVSTFRFSVKGGPTDKLLSGESRKKDGFHYLKLGDGAALDAADLADRLAGKWVRTQEPLLRWLFPPDESAPLEAPPTSEGLDQMKTAIKNVDLFNEITPLPDETLDGAPMRRYHLKLSPDAVVALLLRWQEISTRLPSKPEDFVAASIEVAGWGAPEGDIWIDKKTGYPRKIALASKLTAASGTADVAASAIFSAFGRPVAVEAPGAEDLETVIGTVMQGRLQLAGGRSAESRTSTAPAKQEQKPLAPPAALAGAKDTDGDGLSDSQENFYGSDPSNPDTDGDGYADGQEVKSGMNPTGPGTLFSFGLGN